MDNDFDDSEFPELDVDDEELGRLLKEAEQDINDGFTYEMLTGREGFWLKCNKCGREGEIRERPFPHKFECSMRKRIKD